MQQLQRGVYTAPFLSPDSEAVIISVDAAGRRLREVIVPTGTSPIDIVERLKRELEEVDPIPV